MLHRPASGASGAALRVARLGACVLVGFLGVAAGAPPAARALITPVSVIDGPSSAIVDLGSSAMADDGTGGVVYRKRVGGRIHIFVAQFVNGAWGPAQRVDVGQTFDSSWPVIGAAEGGHLAVAWTNNYSSTTDGLYSATLDSGATRFGSPVAIDLNIGQATATYPSLAMSRGGAALIAYRVITAVSGPSTPNIPPGYVMSDIRMARYDSQFWSGFGNPLERNPDQPVRAPTAGNAPKVGIDLTGQGLLVWQEPDDHFVDRVYARRIFGMVPGNVLQVSPDTIAGKPVPAPADEFAIDVGGFGEGAVAYRQQPAKGSGFTRPRVLADLLPSSFDPKAADFRGAQVADGAGADGPPAAPGPVSIAVDGQGRFDLGFGTGAGSLDATGTETSVAAAVRLDDGASDTAGDPQLTRSEDGTLAAAWKVDEGGSGAVGVLERRSDGTPNRQLVSAPGGGTVRQLQLGGSHRGDAVIGFLQGDGANTQLAALAVRAPPGAFTLATPATWVNAARIPIQWETPPAGAGQILYNVLVDDALVASNLTATQYTLTAAEAGDGVHDVKIQATDAQGQVVESAPSTLMVDRSPPTVRVATRSGGVTVRVADAGGSGLDPSSVRVRFGDGHTSAGHATARHRYASLGSYTIRVTASDSAGNVRRFHRRVRAR